MTTTYLVEICPVEKRGWIIIVFWFFFPLGEICCCGFAYLILSNLDSGNWKLLLIVSSIPIFISWLISMKFLYESPRYLLVFKSLKIIVLTRLKEDMMKGFN